MKAKFHFYLLLFICISSSLLAQPWQEQPSGVTQQLTSASCIDGYNSWVCGYNATVLRTSNSGTNWINVSNNGIQPAMQLVNILGISSSRALTAGYIGSNTWVYYTGNSGANWVQVFTETGGFINAIALKLDSTGFMVGDPVGGRWSLWKTTNNGLNWDSTGLYLPQAGSETGYNNSLVYSQNRIWFGTNNSRIYYSSNNGANWSVQTVPDANVTALWFDLNGNSTGYCGGSAFMKTTNYGANWTTVTSMGTGNIVGMAGLMLWSGNIWYVRSGSAAIYYNDGNGFNVLDYTAPNGTYRHLTTDRQANWPYVGLSVRNNGGISFKWIFVEAINNLGGEIPEEYSLSQNYPNPFNPVTNIKFQIPEAGLVKLVIYTIVGKEIQTIVNQQLLPGSYSVDFNGSNLSSGVYYYRFETNSVTETRKMVLIK